MATIEVDRKALNRLVGLARIDALRKELAGLERKYGQEEAPRRRRRRRKTSKANGQGMPAARRQAISAGVRRANRKKAKVQ
jgi:hypothetical protein